MPSTNGGGRAHRATVRTTSAASSNRKRAATTAGLDEGSREDAQAAPSLVASAVRAGIARIKQENSVDRAGASVAATKDDQQQVTNSAKPLPLMSREELKQEFVALLSRPEYAASGISNDQVKEHFGATTNYPKLIPVVNELTASSRLKMSKHAVNGSLYYTLLSEEESEKLAGLDASTMLVYQTIEKAGNQGIWTKYICLSTNVQQQTLTKICKTLENRKLIKPVKSISAKQRKLYMLYNLTPSQELTGGIWYVSYCWTVICIFNSF
jgi:DNA-binding MarR family transcriptional regulator